MQGMGDQDAHPGKSGYGCRRNAMEKDHEDLCSAASLEKAGAQYPRTRHLYLTSASLKRYEGLWGAAGKHKGYCHTTGTRTQRSATYHRFGHYV